MGVRGGRRLPRSHQGALGLLRLEGHRPHPPQAPDRDAVGAQRPPRQVAEHLHRHDRLAPLDDGHCRQPLAPCRLPGAQEGAALSHPVPAVDRARGAAPHLPEGGHLRAEGGPGALHQGLGAHQPRVFDPHQDRVVGRMLPPGLWVYLPSRGPRGVGACGGEGCCCAGGAGASYVVSPGDEVVRGLQLRRRHHTHKLLVLRHQRPPVLPPRAGRARLRAQDAQRVVHQELLPPRHQAVRRRPGVPKLRYHEHPRRAQQVHQHRGLAGAPPLVRRDALLQRGLLYRQGPVGKGLHSALQSTQVLSRGNGGQPPH
mmetsp:Transcript_21304/g.53694  ORF Transcript_21304/g.53694 Transcript_21304/m.53694 type:complete len:313 (+) Transcript_21304:130-1068(+)